MCDYQKSSFLYDGDKFKTKRNSEVHKFVLNQLSNISVAGGFPKMNAAKFQNSSKYEIYGFDVGYYSAGDLKVIFKCEPKYPPAKIGIFSNMAWYDAVEDFV